MNAIVCNASKGRIAEVYQIIKRSLCTTMFTLEFLRVLPCGAVSDNEGVKQRKADVAYSDCSITLRQSERTTISQDVKDQKRGAVQDKKFVDSRQDGSVKAGI